MELANIEISENLILKSSDQKADHLSLILTKRNFLRRAATRSEVKRLEYHNYIKPLHLYVLSDEEYIVGDWVYNTISKDFYQFKEVRVHYEKKIISSTNVNLNLPYPSDEIIQIVLDSFNNK